MRTLLKLALLFSSGVVSAAAPATESYVKMVCSAVPSGQSALTPMATYFFYMASSAPYPNAYEITQQFPVRYENFMTACNLNEDPSPGHWTTQDYVSVSTLGIRALGQPCRLASQCASARCSVDTGACVNPIVSNPAPPTK